MRILLLFGLFIFGLRPALQSQNTSYLKFDTRTIDLGEVKKGTVVDTVFRFTNPTKETIQIDIIDACVCTALEWTLDEIPPGGEGAIHISFDSNKKDKNEPIDIDITLINEDPNTGGPVMDNVVYTFKMIE